MFIQGIWESGFKPPKKISQRVPPLPVHANQWLQQDRSRNVKAWNQVLG
jgi:hypothetical protein